jgi:hypothetical protein
VVATRIQNPPNKLEVMNAYPLVELPIDDQLDNNNLERGDLWTTTKYSESPNLPNEDEVSEGTETPPYNPIVMNDIFKGSTKYFHKDPNSPHQRFGPPILQNWLPDSGASSHFTPVYSNLVNVKPSCHHVQMAGGSLVIASHVGDVPCYFTNDQGEPSTILLSQVYYIAGLNFRLLSLLYSTTVSGNSVTIANNATTLTFPSNDTTFSTWPVLRRDRNHALMASIVDETAETNKTISPATSALPSLSLELVL